MYNQIKQLNGATRWVAIGISILGMSLGAFVYTHSTFETKAEAAKDNAYVQQHLMDIKADLRELKFDFKQYMRKQ